MNNSYTKRLYNCNTSSIYSYCSPKPTRLKIGGFLSLVGFLLILTNSQAQCGSEPFPDQWVTHELESSELPYRSVYLFANTDIDGDGKKDIVTGGWWYKNPGTASGNWVRHTIGGSFKNMAYIHDFDGDGDPDLLGTKGAYKSADLVWAQNNGSGNFTIHTNIPSGNTTYWEPFLAGIAGANFQSGGPYQMAINWNGAEHEEYGSPVQMLTVPSDPVNTMWTLEDVSPDSLGEDMQAGDIDNDGDLDLFQSSNWLRNEGNGSWTTFDTGLSYVTTPDRAQLSDFDGDGDLDAVVGQLSIGNSNSNRFEFSWWESPANPTQAWTRHILANDINGSLSVYVEDIDKDGDDDIIVGEWKGDNRLIAFENDLCNTGTWIRHELDAGGTGFDHHDSTRVVDIDDDGDFDVISIGWDNIIPRIFENTSTTNNNQDPVANAGTNKTITLPTNSTIINGSGNDPDGGTVTYAWTQNSGPNTATLNNSATANLTANNLIEGTYVFRLTVTDDENDTNFDEVSVTVNPVPNTDIPIVNAGSNQNITLPTNSTSLNGSGNDPDGGTVVFAWTQTSGPSTASLSNINTTNLTASSLIEGSYIFRLTGTDDESDTAFDEVSVTVNPVPNTDIPIISAGNDQNITLPTNSISLNGSGNDPDGGTVEFAWTQTSGPSTASLSNINTTNLTASSLIEGTYIFRLTGTDDESDTAFDEVSVTVNPVPITDIPIVNAGSNQNITLPTNSISLNGSGSDPDGGTIVFAWTQTSGPSTASLSNINTTNLTASSLIEGTYIFRLSGTDDESDTAFDEVSVIVLAEINLNQPPRAVTESDITSGEYPLTVNFTGSNSTDDSAISNYSWDFDNGVTSDIENPSFTFTSTGTFEVELTVTDDEGLTNSSSITITAITPEIINEESTIILEVNPAKEGIARIILQNKPTGTVITSLYLHDATGRLIETLNIQTITSGNDIYELPISTLRDGLYYISMDLNNGEHQALSLMIKN